MASKQPVANPLRSAIDIETRYRYNPDVKSLPAIVPAVILLLLDDDTGNAQRPGVVRGKRAGVDYQSLCHAVTKTEF